MKKEEIAYDILKPCFRKKLGFNQLIKKLGDKDRESFVWLGAFWAVMSGMERKYYKQSTSLIIIFSVIESLDSPKRYQDFFTWLNSKRLEKYLSVSGHNVSGSLSQLKDEWKRTYGASEKFRWFFNNYVSKEDKEKILRKFEVKKKGDASLHKLGDVKQLSAEFSTFAISLRNKFVHRAKLIDVFSPPMLVFPSEGYVVKIGLSFSELEEIIKRAFVRYFQEKVVG